MMPEMDGFTLAGKLRAEEPGIPFIFLTAKSLREDMVRGLKLGADDYITKPFSPGELVARVSAHLRRNRMLRFMMPARQPISHPGLNIDPSSYTVVVNGSDITLTSKEFELLELLARHPNQVFTPEQLFDLVWQENSLGDYRTVVVHVSNLRKKIEPDPSNPKFVLTVRGVGYKFASS